MNDIKEIEKQITYSLLRNEVLTVNNIWNSINKNDLILYNALKLEKNVVRGNNIETFNSRVIAEMIMINKNSVNKDVYKSLVDIIYSNVDIARDYGSILGTTFLVSTFFNHNLSLIKRDKNFVEKEATEMYTLKNISQNVYKYYHNFGNLDLREFVLLNNSWTKDEKKKLIFKFYKTDFIFYDRINRLISYVMYKYNNLDYNIIRNYSEQQLKEYLNEEDKASILYNELDTINFLLNEPPSNYKNEEEKKLKKI